MSRRGAALVLPLAAVSLAAAPVPWPDLTPADLLYDTMTRVATIEGHEVHYPTPTAELVRLLTGQDQPEALRQLAEAQFALGERDAALQSLEAWAVASGPAAWEEAARWAAERLEMPFAFHAAEKAVATLAGRARSELLTERIAWAERYPEHADALALRRARAALLPESSEALEDYIHALEDAGRLDEAERVAEQSSALDRERLVLIRSDLFADRGQPQRAFEILEAALQDGLAPEARQAFAARVDAWNRDLPDRWRTALEARFEPAALLRLSTYFQGQGRGDKAAELLRQVERRHEAGFDRAAFLLVARLHGEIDAVPEAFRAALAAAHLATPEQQIQALPELARLALRAGGRPLAWGRYNEESYRWLARLDRTPGFWTGGLSFLLTGQDWKEGLARLEAASVPERTFETAQRLGAELERRAPEHAELARLRVSIMERHVERGEGTQALALLARVGTADAEVVDAARRVALLAMRQSDPPAAEEVVLFRARLRHRAPDGSQPSLRPPSTWDTGPIRETSGRPWRRPASQPRESYREVLQDAAERLDRRDGSHATTVALFLGELDRLPDAEELWLELTRRLEVWSLDDDLGPRYERALQRFAGPEWWARAARFYARRERQDELRRLAAELAASFRGSALFERANAIDLRVAVPDQPKIGERVRLAPFADLVRLHALKRFPHSPRVVAEALGRLERRSRFEARLRDLGPARLKPAEDRVVVEDDVMERRRWAVMFADPQRREELFARKMSRGELPALLRDLEARADPTPVELLLLYEGWSRLSRFEHAAPFGDRLAASYPGDRDLAYGVLALHRSLSGLDPAHALPARLLVERVERATPDPAPLWTELGELHEERGDPQAAIAVWQRIVDREPRNPERIREVATLLWDYGHMPEALEVVEAARRRLDRPRLLAFEAGVLREETRDVAGAVREYLSALQPEFGRCFCSTFEEDQRALRRLSQLLARKPALRLVADRLTALRPGAPADEAAFAALLPLATITPPVPGGSFDADDWIDSMDLPNDPLGRAEREARREAARPRQHAAVGEIAERLLAKAEPMAAGATAVEFLDSLSPWAVPLLQGRSAERAVGFQDVVMARRAALAPSEEERVAREAERARFLAERGRPAAADALWSGLAARIRALPESAVKLRAEADRAGYVERTRGPQAASEEWRALGERYPWSLGILEDRVAFLGRAGRPGEALDLLAAAAPRAGDGRREELLERLLRAALDQRDRPRARGAVERLLLEPRLAEARRLGALHLLARLRFQEDPSFDALPLVTAEAKHFRAENVADLYAHVARAASIEGAGAAAVALWTHALDRRLDRGFLREAARAARGAGKDEELRNHFERQQARSPRDVRWAVAARELRREADDVAGAIEMAKTAVAIRPERESLWREGVELLVRGDRHRDAADFLEGWNRARAADESVAAWRSRLYARAQEPARALAIEKAALLAYEKGATTAKERGAELDARRGRAARRLIAYGLPDLAWQIVAPGDAVSRLRKSGLGENEQVELALAVGRLPRLLAALDGAARLRTAGEAFRERALTEDQDALRTFLLGEIAPSSGPSLAGLRQYWPFLEASGLEASIRFALAERELAARPGPWSGAATVHYLEEIGDAAVLLRSPGGGGPAKPVFSSPDLDRLWVRELVRRDDAAALGAYLAPRLAEALATALGEQPLPASERPLLEWAAWLDADALSLWSRHLSADPASRAGLDAVFAKRAAWDRFWALAARAWDAAPFVASLSEPARTAWLGYWIPSGLSRTEREVLARVGRLLGRLVTGDREGGDETLMRQLRGPRTVGELLTRDASLDRPAFGTAAAEALWGGRLGEGWWSLETLRRIRNREPGATLLALEFPERGGEVARSLLAAALSEKQGDLDAALSSLAPAAATNSRAEEAALRLLLRLGRGDEAKSRFVALVRHQQERLDEAALRELEALAEDLSLPSPVEALDPDRPLKPALLAHLHERRGEGVAARYQTKDRAGFRAALAVRFAAREVELDADQIRYWIFELWANGAAGFPGGGLRRLGGLWPHAAAWLELQTPADRPGALAAVGALPEASRFDALVRARGQEQQESARLLAVRAALAGGNEARAAALLSDALREMGGESPLRYEAASLEAPSHEGAEPPEGADEADLSEPEPETPQREDPWIARLAAWLAAFHDAGRDSLAAPKVAELLLSKRAQGPVSVSAWSLAFQIATDEPARSALERELEHAWLRGDWEPEALRPVVETLARFAPRLAGRWLARWPESSSFGDARIRARVLERVVDREAAARSLIAARARRGFTAEDDVRAFDHWRRLGEGAAASTPTAWLRARPFWARPPAEALAALVEHLKVHPTDRLAARSALRSVAPALEPALRRAGRALAATTVDVQGASDARILRLRAARGQLPSSRRGAQRALAELDTSDLAQDLERRRFPRAEVDGALRDVALLAAAAGSTTDLEVVLIALRERNAPGLGALRAELRALRPTPAPGPFRLAQGQPAFWRPRDLSFRLVAEILTAESAP